MIGCRALVINHFEYSPALEAVQEAPQADAAEIAEAKEKATASIERGLSATAMSIIIRQMVNIAPD